MLPDRFESQVAAAVERTAKQVGIVDLAISMGDPRRWIGMTPDGRRAVIHVKPVGGKNAGEYKGWVAGNKGDWRRIAAERPDMYKSFTLMVGHSPDEEYIWWGQMFDDDILRKVVGGPGVIEWMMDGRFGRLRPDQAKPAALQFVDFLQTDLGLVDPVSTPEPAPVKPNGDPDALEAARRQVLEYRVWDRLTGDQVRVLFHEVADRAMGLVDTRAVQGESNKKKHG